MIIHNEMQGTPEWLQARLGKFTASSSQSIQANGKGLDTLVFEKVAEKLTNKPISEYTNNNMERGNELEDEARSVYELQSGNTVHLIGFCELDVNVGASPDGLVGDDGLVEIKNPTPKVFAEYLFTKKVDPKYYAQMQMQMYVTDRKWCDYVVYHPDFPTPCIITRIDRDETYIEKIKVGLEAGIKKYNEIMGVIKNG